MNSTLISILAVLGIGTFFIVGILVGGAIVIKGVVKVIKFIFDK